MSNLFWLTDAQMSRHDLLVSCNVQACGRIRPGDGHQEQRRFLSHGSNVQMHILILVWYRALQGGLHDNVAGTVGYLLEQQYQVTVVCPPGPFVQRMEACGARVYPTVFSDWEAFETSGMLEGDYDLVHAHPGLARVWGLRVSARLGLPFFMTFHGSWTDQIEDYWQKCSRIFAVSPAVRENILSRAPAAGDRVLDMPNTAGHAGVSSHTVPWRAPDQRPLRVLIASRFDKDKKGVLEMLQALWSLQGAASEAGILWEVAGDGTEMPLLREAAERLRAAIGHQLVNFHGWLDREALDTLEAKCNLALCPGRSALNSLERGIPTIALASAGCFGLVSRENFWQAIHSNFGGYGLREPISPQALFDTLRRLADPRAPELSETVNCANLARSYFSRGLWGARLLASYAVACDGNKQQVFASPYMPNDEIAHLTRAYAGARIILEYGSGGSTEIAARMPGKRIMSVDSDRNWLRALRTRLTGPDILSVATLYHADIGETGPWGRVLDDNAWRNFHDYPNAIWDQPWFRHPDIVLIDGRFRTACLAAVLMRAERPVRVLFDDYTVRPIYHEVEKFIRPIRIIGRMAEFFVEPGQVRPEDIGLLLRQFFRVSIHGLGEEQYVLPT